VNLGQYSAYHGKRYMRFNVNVLCVLTFQPFMHMDNVKCSVRTCEIKQNGLVL